MIKRIDREPTSEIIAESLANNTFMRTEDVRNFMRLLKNTQPPYVWCVDARWGDGKTFFVKAVQLILECGNPHIDTMVYGEIILPLIMESEEYQIEQGEFVPAYFNAWENDSAESPLCALTASIAADFDEKVESGSNSIADKAATIIDTAAGVLGCSLGLRNLRETLTGNEVIDEVKKRRFLENQVDELIEAICIERANKMILFIDELDRCRPDFAIRLLSDIKSLFNNDRLIIVYSTDLTQLSNALEGFYGTSFDSRKYLERFYDRKIGFSQIRREGYIQNISPSFNGRSHYESMVRALIERKQLTMRDLNRLGKFEEAKAYIDSQGSIGIQYVDFGIMYVNSALLPVFIVLEYLEPTIWNHIKVGTDFECVYDYAKDIPAFVEAIDEAIHCVYNVSTSSVDQTRIDFISDVCSLIFLPPRERSERRKRASSSLNYMFCNALDIKAFRFLDFMKQSSDSKG